jgi:hypothetical protein
MAGKELAAAGLADIARQTHDALLQIDCDTSVSVFTLMRAACAARPSPVVDRVRSDATW